MKSKNKEISSPKLKRLLKDLVRIEKAENYLDTERGKLTKEKEIVKRKIKKEKEILELKKQIERVKNKKS